MSKKLQFGLNLQVEINAENVRFNNGTTREMSISTDKMLSILSEFQRYHQIINNPLPVPNKYHGSNLLAEREEAEPSLAPTLPDPLETLLTQLNHSIKKHGDGPLTLKWMASIVAMARKSTQPHVVKPGVVNKIDNWDEVTIGKRIPDQQDDLPF